MDGIAPLKRFVEVLGFGLIVGMEVVLVSKKNLGGFSDRKSVV